MLSNIKKILIIDNAKIGDLVCATPVFRAIKEEYPEAHLTVLLIPRTEGILRNNGRVNEIMVASLNNIGGVKEVWKLLREIKKRNFDVSINLVPGTLNFLLPFLAGIPLRITSVNRNLKLFYRILSCLTNRQILFEKDTLSIRHYLELLKLMHKILLTKEVARMLRLHEEYVRELIRQRKIKAYREGRRGGYRITIKAVEDYITKKHKELEMSRR